MANIINPMNFSAAAASTTQTLFAITPSTPNAPFAIPAGAQGTVLTINASNQMQFIAPTIAPAVNTISTASGTLIQDTQNFCTFAGACTATLPASITSGAFIWIYSIGGSVVVAQNASQQIHAGTTSSTAGVTGNLTLPNVYQSTTLVQTSTANELIVGNLMFNGTLT
jgi:hypothetical protein